MIYENIVTCFYNSDGYLSMVTHKSVNCLNPAGKAVMKARIQNLSFESYLLASTDHELKRMFKPKLSCIP